MPSSLELLPPSLLAYILELAISGFSQELDKRGYKPPLDDLKNIALVSKTLFLLIRDLVRNILAETLEFSLPDNATPTRVATEIQVVAAKGAPVRGLQVKLGPFDSIFSVKVPGPGKLEEMDIDWATVFGYMPKLMRLDLSSVPLSSRHFENILEAASKNCPLVEVLALPCKGNITQSISGSEPEKLIALCNAMETWYIRGRRGGLKVLALPPYPEQKHLPFRNSKFLFDALARYCPGIKFVAKYPLVNFVDQDYYDEKWAISLETWKAFNRSCTALTQFHWQVVPFADPYFRAFGDHMKPQLKTLTLWSNPTWKYKRYMYELEETYLVEARGCPGYGVRASDVAAVLKACPALTVLSIEIHHLGGYRTDEMYEDVEVYGDVFWESAARHCPSLERISVSTCDHDDYHTILVKTLTDRTLMHLAELPYLLKCHLPLGRVTGRGVFEYIQLVSKTTDLTGNKRSILISIGGVKRKPVEVPVFYSEILELMKLLAETDEVSLGAAFCHPKPNVVVHHPYESSPGRAWLSSYTQNELEPLLKTVQEKHPSLKVDVDTSRSYINEIQLLWFYE